MTIAWFNHAHDWAELNDVPLVVYRDDDDDWCARIELRDARGWFSFSVKSFGPSMIKVDEKTRSGQPKKRKETPSEFHARVDKSLTSAVQKARESRIKEYAKIDPRTQARHAGSLAA